MNQIGPYCSRRLLSIGSMWCATSARSETRVTCETVDGSRSEVRVALFPPVSPVSLEQASAVTAEALMNSDAYG